MRTYLTVILAALLCGCTKQTELQQALDRLPTNTQSGGITISNPPPRYELLELNGLFAFRDNRSGYISPSFHTCEEAKTLLHRTTNMPALMTEFEAELRARREHPWKVIDCP